MVIGPRSASSTAEERSMSMGDCLAESDEQQSE